MRMTTTASIAALAALAILATLTAAMVFAVRAGAATQMQTQAPMMLAQDYQQRQIGPGDGPKAAKPLWYIRGMLTLDGSTRETKYMVPTQADGQSVLAVLTFDSKEECEGALAEDDEIMMYIGWLKAHVAERGGNLVLSCQPYVVQVPGQDV